MPVSRLRRLVVPVPRCQAPPPCCHAPARDSVVARALSPCAQLPITRSVVCCAPAPLRCPYVGRRHGSVAIARFPVPGAHGAPVPLLCPCAGWRHGPGAPAPRLAAGSRVWGIAQAWGTSPRAWRPRGCVWCWVWGVVGGGVWGRGSWVVGRGWWVGVVGRGPLVVGHERSLGQGTGEGLLEPRRRSVCRPCLGRLQGQGVGRALVAHQVGEPGTHRKFFS